MPWLCSGLLATGAVKPCRPCVRPQTSGAATCRCIASGGLATLLHAETCSSATWCQGPDNLSLLSCRYNPNKGLITLTSEAQETREENRVELLQILRALVEEGRKAFPSASAEEPQQQSAAA